MRPKKNHFQVFGTQSKRIALFSAAALLIPAVSQADGDDPVGAPSNGAPLTNAQSGAGGSAAPSAGSVNNSGGFSYAVPIQIPAGRRGVEPRLALVYNSFARNGIAGVGWQLTGLPVIVRMNFAQGVSYDSGDTFVLLQNGWGSEPDPRHRLVNEYSNTYHLARDAKSRLTSFTSNAAGPGQCGRGPCYWEMRDGSGNRFIFGDQAQLTMTNQSVIKDRTHSPARGIFAWALTRFEDAYGNAYTVTYRDAPDNFYPQSILYTRPTPIERDLREVRFDYENRTDATPMPARFTQRLKTIAVRSAGHLVRTYTLTYAPNPSAQSGRSLLAQIQESGATGVTLPAHRFRYTPGALNVSGEPDPLHDIEELVLEASAIETRDPGGSVEWQTHFADINGDGRDDVIRVYQGLTNCGYFSCDNTTRVTYRLSTSTGFGREQIHTHLPSTGVLPQYDYPTPDVFAHNPDWRSLMADVNGDGRADLVLYRVGWEGFEMKFALGQTLSGREWRALGPLQRWWPHTLSWPRDSADRFDRWVVLVGDFNGDQKQDLVVLNHQRRLLYTILGTTYGLGAAVANPRAPWVSSAPTCLDENAPRDCVNFIGAHAVDLNGDGKSDVVVAWSSKPSQNPGSTWVAPTCGLGGHVRLATAMGEDAGLGAILDDRRDVDSGFAHRTYGVPAGGQQTAVGDVNGDGKSDLMLAYRGIADILPPCQNPASDTRFAMGPILREPILDRLKNRNPMPRPQLTLNADFQPHFLPPQTHQAAWRHMLADINGDGIADTVQFYRGHMGTRLHLDLGSPFGPATSERWRDSTEILSDPTPQNDGFYPYRQWHALVADLNGDGNADLISWLRSSDTVADISFGSSSGRGLRNALRRFSQYLTGDSEVRADGSRHRTFPSTSNRQVFAVDVNGDGRADLAFVHNGLIYRYPRYTNQVPALGIARSRSATPPGDLLEQIDTPLGGTINVTYKSLADFTDAIRPDATTCNDEGQGCGIADKHPRTLVLRIVRDRRVGPAPTTRSTTYDYHNGRYLPGSVETRTSLGFEFVDETDGETGIVTKTEYFQSAQKSGLAKTREIRDVNRGIIGGELHEYEVRRPVHSEAVVIAETSKYTADYDPTGRYPIQTKRLTRTVDDFGFVTSEDDCASDGRDTVCVKHLTGFASPDRRDWNLGRVDWIRTETSAGLFLDYHRYFYSPTSPSAFEVVRHERLLADDATTFRCRVMREERDTCRGEISRSRGLMRWVVVEQNRQSDAYGNLAYREDGFGRASRTTYDLRWGAYVTIAENALGHRVVTEYDDLGQVALTVDANQAITVRTYDDFGRPKAVYPPIVNGPAEGQTSWQHLDEGDATRQSKVTKVYSDGATSSTKREWFDGFGTTYKVEESDFGRGTTRILTEEEIRSHRKTARHSRPFYCQGATSCDPVTWIETVNDIAGRPAYTVRVAPDGATKTLSTFTHTANSVTETNADRKSTTVTRGPRGVVKTRRDAAGNTTTYTYDELERVTKIRFQTGKEMRYRYDSWGRKRFFTDPETGTTSFHYDDVGNVIQTTDANGRWILTSYDALNRPRYTLWDQPNPHQIVTVLEYDAARRGIGRLSRASSIGNEVVVGEYDEGGNVVQRSETIDGLPNAQTHTYVYDWMNRLRFKVFPDGATEEHRYHPNNGPLREVQLNGQSVASFDLYDPSKKVGQRQTGAGTTTTFGYNDDTLLESLRTVDLTGGVLQYDTFTYSRAGNLATIADRRANKVVGSVNTDNAQVFTYDLLDRLKTAQGQSYALTIPATDRSFDYDAVGNMTLKHGIRIESYGCFMSHCTRGKRGAAVEWVAGQDRAGNRVRFEDRLAGVTTDYSYDNLNRLVSAGTTPGGKAVVFSYDHAERRVKKVFTQGSVTVATHYYGGDYEIRTSTASPWRESHTKRIIAGPFGEIATITDADVLYLQAPAATVNAFRSRPFFGDTLNGSPQGTYFNHPNVVGSTAVVTNGAGSVVTRMNYRPFGELVPSRSVGYDTTTAKFTRKEFDEEMGLSYFGGRYYDSVSGRFITPDSIVPSAGSDAQKFNRYAYASNNPLRLADPSGHTGEDAQNIYDGSEPGSQPRLSSGSSSEPGGPRLSNGQAAAAHLGGTVSSIGPQMTASFWSGEWGKASAVWDRMLNNPTRQVYLAADRGLSIEGAKALEKLGVSQNWLYNKYWREVSRVYAAMTGSLGMKAKEFFPTGMGQIAKLEKKTFDFAKRYIAPVVRNVGRGLSVAAVVSDSLAFNDQIAKKDYLHAGVSATGVIGGALSLAGAMPGTAAVLGSFRGGWAIGDAILQATGGVDGFVWRYWQDKALNAFGP